MPGGGGMPVLGLGTYLNNENTKEVVKRAIMEFGYKHIDTASDYENEEQIGEALQECMEAGIMRESLFITTKIWISDYLDSQ